MLQNWIKNTQSRIVHEKDTIVPSLVNLFDLTIQGLGLKPISSKVSPLDSNVLSPCRHLVLFPQRLTEPQLASDGYETLFNPPGYSIRMWAGGNLTWISKNPLRFGQDVSLTATMPTVTLKQTTRGEAVFTTLHRSISNVAGPSVIETRSLVYLPASTISDRSIKRSLVPDFTFTCTPTSISLFRFSSVTFNSHKIHYDQQYAKQEGDMI
ncbi:hypothetical protein HDV02_001619 [Globomyces sp. JEL0801]|nr:hypothetical protein HDV02_001619 [Globomyces sp. JEL0801]